jgi:hypothetical protein
MSAKKTQPWTSYSALELELTELEEAVHERLPEGVTFHVDGVAMDREGIEDRLGDWLDACEEVDTAKAAYQEAVAARKAIAAEARTFRKMLRSSLRVYLGPDNPDLAYFGIAPDGPVRRTPMQYAIAAAKRAQTRALRRTLGKKARAGIIEACTVPVPPLPVPPPAEPAELALDPANDDTDPDDSGSGAAPAADLAKEG